MAISGGELEKSFKVNKWGKVERRPTYALDKNYSFLKKNLSHICIFSNILKCVYHTHSYFHHHWHNCQLRFQCFLQQLFISCKQFSNISHHESLSPDNFGSGRENFLLAQKLISMGCNKNVLVCIF